MMTPSRFKTALLAGAALTAAATAVAHAADRAPIAPVAIEQAIAAADQGDADKALPAKPPGGWTIYAAGAAILAAIARLVGFRRIAAGAKNASAAAAKAATATARVVGRAIGSPFRAAIALLSLGLLALTGVGLYDIEWIGGMVFGALMAGAVFLGAHKARRTLAFARRTARR